MNPHHHKLTWPVIILLLIALLSGQIDAGRLPSQDQPAAPIQEFLFIDTRDASTLEKELNSNAQSGWRLHQLPKSSLANAIGALLTRAEAGKRYEYKVLAARRVSTIEKEFTQAAAEGWEFRGVLSRFDFGDLMKMAFTHVGSETFIVLEREAGETRRRFEYRILSAQRKKTTQQELDQAVAEGYIPLAIAGGMDTSGAMVLLGPKIVLNIVLSRGVESSGPDKGRYEYRIMGTAKVKTLEKEMNQAAKEGFRYYLSTPPLVVLMRREKERAEKGRYEYHLLATLKKATMGKEMNEQGALGYHYVATGGGLSIATFFEHDTLEKADVARRDYLILRAAREATIQKQIGESLAAGWTLRDLTNTEEYVVVFDRPAPPAAN
ncbi:MAG TPA: hypothetical protein VFY40_18230 [Blastocatellia bacterium]|nr:hypothetical protein [Blastocatellia bacterium]